MGILIGFFLGAETVSLVSHFNSLDVDIWAWADGFAQNFGTEMFGAFLTFLLIESLVGNRRERRRLIRQMGSPDNGIALQAVRELEAHGWLRDGSLQGAALYRANLQGANLGDANLQGADLVEANLQEANLGRANLQGALLKEANLQEAYLDKANLQGADLEAAHLQEVDLYKANLQGADLVRANLQGASLLYADFDTETILPDNSKAMLDTDFESLRHFTDPEHPNFWRSSDHYSPAYRGDDDDGDDDDNND
jgi:hypothetical protein